MIELVRFTVVLIGLVYLVTESVILMDLRVTLLHLLKRYPTLQTWVASLIYCPPCAAFWIGMSMHPSIAPFEGIWAFETAVIGVAIGAVFTQLVPPGAYSREEALWCEEDEENDETKEVQGDQ